MRHATQPPKYRAAIGRSEAGPARGILHSQPTSDAVTHRRVLPCKELAPFIAHFWQVQWKLVQPQVVETIPHPTVHVVFEQNSTARVAEVAGIFQAKFTRTLVGEGWALGVKFRPAMFAVVFGQSMKSLSEKVLPLATVLGEQSAALAEAVFEATEFEARMRAAERYFGSVVPSVDPLLANLRDVVERVEMDRSILRVQQVAALASLDRRTLQRHFLQKVGVSPKWVIQRYRLHEAAERLKCVPPPEIAAIAAELGYADQAHFSRDFKNTVGCSPRQFVRRLRSN